MLDDPSGGAPAGASSPSQCSSTTGNRRRTRSTGSTSPTGRGAEGRGGGDRGDGGDAGGAKPRSGATSWTSTGWSASRRGCCRSTTRCFLLLAEPGRMRFRVGDGLLVRLVDVGAALAARSYDGRRQLVLRSRRGSAPGTTRASRLDGVDRRRAAPDLRLSVDTLASVIPRRLHASSSWRGSAAWRRSTEGALARADALFRTDRKPWCPEIF